MEAGGPELVNEAELRHWKSHVVVELLVEFTDSAMTPDDTTKALARMETLHAVTYEGFQEAKKVLAGRKAAVVWRCQQRLTPRPRSGWPPWRPAARAARCRCRAPDARHREVGQLHDDGVVHLGRPRPCLTAKRRNRLTRPQVTHCAVHGAVTERGKGSAGMRPALHMMFEYAGSSTGAVVLPGDLFTASVGWARIAPDGMMPHMDQGDAAVWAAALGIAGTLAGALGGAVVQGRVTRRQVRDQEAVDLRHRLRQERQAAFAAVLDRCTEIETALTPVVLAYTCEGDWQGAADSVLWAPVDAALPALQRAVTAVAITGPDSMASRASAIQVAMLAKANTWRLAEDFLERARLFAENTRALEQAQRDFIQEARTVLDAPGGQSPLS
ncbi:hypothetical protein ACF1FE_26380 [Streptomyces griseofuscus]|uniref:hypothetical protein n=2 Tax=Streptomyces griseofuscus TaxID=146922 RepID=UPI0036FAE675